MALAHSWTVALSDNGTTWHDVTAYVDADEGITITPATHGGADEPEPAPGEASLALYGEDGVWWPDNPTSPRWPLPGRALRCRISGTVGTSTTWRHYGTVRSWEPDPGDAPAEARIRIVSVDVLADLATLTYQDRLTEHLRYTAALIGAPTRWDSWPLVEDAGASSLASGRVGSTAAGRVVPARSGAGTIETGDLDPGNNIFGPWNLARMVTFTPGQDGTGADIPVTPVMLLPVTAQTSGQTYLAFRTSVQSDRVIAEGYAPGAQLAWRIGIHPDNGLLYLLDDAETSTYLSLESCADGAWHTVVTYLPHNATPGASQTREWYIDGVYRYAQTGVDTSALRWIVVGGSMSPRSRGKQARCMTGDVTMLGVLGQGIVGGLERWCARTSDSAHDAVSLAIGGWPAAYTDHVDAAWSSTSARVARAPFHDRTALDVAHITCTTTGHRLRVVPSATAATLYAIAPKLIPSTTPTATIILGDDDHAPMALTRGGEATPTRATVDAPDGGGTWIDVAAETATGRPRRLDADTIETWSTTQRAAIAVAGGHVQGLPGRTLHIDQLAVDLTTSVSGQPLATAMLALTPGGCVTVTEGPTPGTLARWTGRTSDDHVASGWTETWDADGVTMDLRLYRAEDVPRTVLDDPGGRGRLCAGTGVLTVTGGSAAIGTGTGTVQVTTTRRMRTGTPITWDWAGEWVTGTASGTSTVQTLTISARGVGGTVARAHVDGQPLDVATPARLGP